MEMKTVYIVTDPAAPRLRRENRRLHKDCIIFRRIAIAATAVVLIQTVFYLAMLTRMDSVHKTIESASRSSVAAAQQETSLYKSLLSVYEAREADL